MATVNYREQSIAGQSWRRCHRVVIHNPYMGQPAVTMDEEQVTQLGGSLQASPTAILNCNVDLANGTIPLLDPDTGAATGRTMTHAQVYQALYSLYMQLAAQRDAATP